MDFDLSKRYCYFFSEIASIPHGSYNEKEISDYVVSFAEKNGLRYIQDEFWNVIVYKDASAGYEQSEPLLIQAHMDMVCEANKETNHDFLKDSLKLRVDDGWLSAEGTTLGADDGAGVAYMLAILEDEDLPHPPLECCFTVQEEVGLIGSMKLKKEYFRSKRMISLDGGGEVRTCISSAGGTKIESSIKCQTEPNADPTYDLYVGGLAGGHSGGEIDKERGNAITIAVRAVKELQLSGIDVHLTGISGGLKENAIPRECDICFTSSSEQDEIRNALSLTEKGIAEELEFSDPGVSFSLTAAETADTRFTADSSARTINYLYLIPNGFRHRSMAIEGLTVTSLNLGVVRTQGDTVSFCSTIRSALNSGTSNLVNKIRTLADVFGAETDIAYSFSGWNYSPVSELREKLAVVLRKEFGVELECQATHGGCECGVFNALGLEDIITYGPITKDIHTPDERLDLASFDRSYIVLTDLIKECR